MERPWSAASSSATALSTTSSKPTLAGKTLAAAKVSAPTVVSLFVTNLRLLNLDLLTDWPNITISSFSNHDARTKIRCCEYALYQLFRLYDPATTADKLQPFFPPLEPLQSVNLRAALYRCLNELKKNGVLPRDIVLRKTMLDECNGDKFWEVCLSFSAIVLRKVTMGKRDHGVGRPVAAQLGMAQTLSKDRRDILAPLLVAHKGALGKVLVDRQRKKQTYTTLYELLAEKEHELRQRKAMAEDRARKANSINPERLRAVETIVQKNWIGSTDLRDALLEGDTWAKGDGMLVKSFEDLWQTQHAPGRPQSTGAEIGLLQHLNKKAAEQTTRLKKWQSLHEKLVVSKASSTHHSSRPQSGTQRVPLRFDRHREMNLQDDTSDGDSFTPQRRSRHADTARYDEILTTMREQLRKTCTHRGKPPAKPSHSPVAGIRRAHTQPIPMRRQSSFPVDTSPGASNVHTRSPSQTAVPVRGMAFRVASRSRSYQQPKVESQRGLVPLKAELFSPLKSKPPGSVSPHSPNSALTSPVERPSSLRDSVGSTTDTVQMDDADRKHANHDSGLGITIDALPMGKFLGVDRGSKDLDLNPRAQMPAFPAEKQQHQPFVPRPSLAERTRMSMAPRPHEEDADSSLQPTTPSDMPTSPSAQDTDPTFHADTPTTTLLERTRQSIVTAPPLRSSHQQAPSQTFIYPINQFETPQKQPPAASRRRSTVATAKPDQQRKVTPMEHLLSPDAEYDSVFKSRPRVAHSPVLTPFRDVEAGAEEECGSERADARKGSPLVV